MAELSANGHEVARYFDPTRGVLVSVRSNGKRLYRGVGTPCWRVLATKNAAVSLDQWLSSKLRYMNNLPWWCSQVKSLPSLATLQEWQTDSICETVTGDQVEPDGHGPDGAPIWLVALRMI